MTTTSASIRYKLSQNFAQKYALRMNDDSDYNSIFGNANKQVPAKFIGRGLVKLDNIHEFQTASITEENELEFIKEEVTNLSKKYNDIKVNEIPVLPSKIILDKVIKAYKNLNTVPLGIEKEELVVSTFELKKQFCSLISSQDISDNKSFIYSFITELQMIKNNNLFVLDASNIFDKNTFNNLNYYNDDLTNVYKNIEELIKKYNENLDQNLSNNVIIILGIENFINKVTLNENINLKTFLMEAKKSNKFDFVIVDNDTSLKKYAYEEWYRNNVVSSQGIWLGNGITEQYVIKLSKIDKKLYQEIGNKFGYLVENGVPTLIKLIDFLEDGENNE